MKIVTEVAISGDLHALQIEFERAVSAGTVEAFLKQPLSTFFSLSVKTSGVLPLTQEELVAKLASEIGALDLNTDCANAVQSEGAKYVWQVIEMDDNAIRRLKGAGPKNREKIYGALEKFGTPHRELHGNAELIALAKARTGQA